jgi:hypothetical protein
MMRGLKAMTLSAAVAMVLTGCVQSALNPTDKVVLSGAAQNEDKSPLSSTELSLERSSGSACLIVAAFAKPSTDAQGAFTSNLTGADSQNGDVARCFRLALPAGAKGAAVWADFLVQVTDVKVPTLQQWNGAVSASAAAAGAEFKYTDLSGTHGLNGLDYTVEARAGNGTVWMVEKAASPVAFSDYVLEDFTVTATAIASTPVKGSGTTFTLRYQTDATTLPLRTLVPVSRGAACAYTGAPAVCPLTDGKTDRVQFAAGIPDVTVTLATAKVLKKAVLRGAQFSAPATVVLEGSADGTTWTSLATVAVGGEYQELSLTAAPAVKQVRVKGTRTDTGTFAILNLDELSLFE